MFLVQYLYSNISSNVFKLPIYNQKRICRMIEEFKATSVGIFRVLIAILKRTR